MSTIPLARERAGPRARHAVHLYRSEDDLVSRVAEWVVPQLRGGQGALLVGTPEHARVIMERLREMGARPDDHVREGRLVLLDAEDTMRRTFEDGLPRGSTFKRALRERLATMGQAGARDVRAWGEMVDLLWQRGQFVAMRRLEEIWNDVIDEHGVELLCSYHVDELASDTHTGAFAELCTSHSHVVSDHDETRFAGALREALGKAFGGEAERVWALLARRSTLPIEMRESHAVIVGLIDLHPTLGRDVLREVRSALSPASNAPR